MLILYLREAKNLGARACSDRMGTKPLMPTVFAVLLTTLGTANVGMSNVDV